MRAESEIHTSNNLLQRKIRIWYVCQWDVVFEGSCELCYLRKRDPVALSTKKQYTLTNKNANQFIMHVSSFYQRVAER